MTQNILEEGTTDLPISVSTGTARPKKIAFCRCEPSANTDTWGLATVMPNINDIEGFVWATLDGAHATTYPTFSSGSTAAVTFGPGAGVWEIGVIANETI